MLIGAVLAYRRSVPQSHVERSDRDTPLAVATALLARRPTKVAAIALANKLARMAWAMMARNERYKEPAALTA